MEAFFLLDDLCHLECIVHMVYMQRFLLHSVKSMIPDSSLSMSLYMPQAEYPLLQSLVRAMMVTLWRSTWMTYLLVVDPGRLVKEELRLRAEGQRVVLWSQPANVVRALDLLEHQQRAQQHLIRQQLSPERDKAVLSWPLQGGLAVDLDEEALLEESQEPWPYVTEEDLSFFLGRLQEDITSITAVRSTGPEDLRPLPSPIIPVSPSFTPVSSFRSNLGHV